MYAIKIKIVGSNIGERESYIKENDKTKTFYEYNDALEYGLNYENKLRRNPNILLVRTEPVKMTIVNNKLVL